MKRLFWSFILLSLIPSLKAEYLKDKLSSYGRWSMSGEFGFNRFDADLKPNGQQFFDGLLMSPNLGFNLEYSLHPNFGIGWSFGGLMMNQVDGNEEMSFGALYTNPYITFDLLSLVRGSKSKHWSIWLNAGVGLAGLIRPYYNSSSHYVPDITHAVIYPPVVMTIPATLGLEYSVSKNVSLGVNARFVATNSDQLEATDRMDWEDFWQTANLTLRYKFVTKDKKHFRDEIFKEEDPSISMINQLQIQVNQLSSRVDGIDGRLDSIDSRLERIEGIMAVNGPDTDLDGVPDVRDLEPNTPRGNAVDFWGRTIMVKAKAADEVLSVYFDFDRSDLDKLAKITIIKVASKMKENTELMLEIRGYTDDPGANQYNQKLSQRRAESVKAELVKVYGISSGRIVANGKGKVPYPPGKTIANRRCDFFFSK